MPQKKNQANLINEWLEPIHDWFGLSYASYLVIPRSVLQSMPVAWQMLLISLVNKMNETVNWDQGDGLYQVRLKNADGKFITDPYRDYERGRRRVPLRDQISALPKKVGSITLTAGLQDMVREIVQSKRPEANEPRIRVRKFRPSQHPRNKKGQFKRRPKQKRK